jgi:hypothetical protein
VRNCVSINWAYKRARGKSDEQRRFNRKTHVAIMTVVTI